MAYCPGKFHRLQYAMNKAFTKNAFYDGVNKNMESCIVGDFGNPTGLFCSLQPGPCSFQSPQSVVTLLHTEDPKRDPKQGMDLCRFSSTVESSNSDPNTQTK